MVSEKWHQFRLADLCEAIDYGYTAAASIIPVGAKFLRITDIVGRYLNWNEVPFCDVDESTREKYRLHHEDIVIARTGATTGVSAFIADPPDALFASYLVRLKIGKLASARFISYFLKSSEFWDYIHGVLGDKSAQPNASARTMTQVKLLVPPYPEQLAISHILGALDDKIELNHRINETLEAIARAIFKSWFVDFDPVRAKMEGREPYGMDAETAALFPGSFEDSALGKIPKGWNIKNLPEVIEINPQRSLSKGQSAPYLEMSNMPTSSARALDWEYRDFSSGMKFMNGDVLLARITPCLENGKTAYVDFLADGQVGWGSTEYIVLFSKPPLPREYAYFLARSDELRTHAIQNMTGTSGRQRVPAECFKAYPIVVPPEKIAVQFGEIVRPFMQAIKQYDEESRTLAAIRDALLPKLLSGEIRVKEAEKYAKTLL